VDFPEHEATDDDSPGFCFSKGPRDRDLRLGEVTFPRGDGDAAMVNGEASPETTDVRITYRVNSGQGLHSPATVATLTGELAETVDAVKQTTFFVAFLPELTDSENGYKIRATGFDSDGDKTGASTVRQSKAFVKRLAQFEDQVHQRADEVAESCPKNAEETPFDELPPECQEALESAPKPPRPGH